MKYHTHFKFLLPGIFLIFSLSAAFGQSYKLSADTAQFRTDAKAMMASTRYTASVEIGARFDSVFRNLPHPQKEKIIGITQLMLKAKLKPRPHFEDYFSLLNSAVTKANLGGAALDNLLEVTEKVMQKTDPKQAQKFLTTSNLFLESRKLHQSKENRLYTDGGSFAFAFIEEKAVSWDEQSAEPEKPAPKAETQPKKETPKKEEPKKKKDDWADDWGDDWGSGWDAPAPKKAAAAPAKDDWDAPAPIAETLTETATQAFYPTPQPIMKGAILTFTNTQFAFATPFDSVLLSNVSGSLMLTEDVFVGTSGTLSWANAGHPDKQITSTFGKYNFNISNAELSAEEVTLEHPEMLLNPIKGNIQYKSVRRPSGKAPSYPRFISLTNDAKIKNLGENIDYKGGFSVAGQTVASNALDESLSTITVKLNGAPKFRAQAKSYAFGDSIIVSKLAAISIYQGLDSVSHPGMKFKYNKNTNMLTLLQDDGGLRNAMFFDSYHKIEIRAEMVKWDLNAKEIDFSILTARTEKPLVLESEQYFTPSRFIQTGGVMTFHPLQAVATFSQRKKTNKFYVHELAEFLKVKDIAVKEAMADLARDGYVEYSGKTGLVVIKPRTWHYVESAKGKKDFDNIKIESINEANKNATLNLETNDLTVRGVKRFYLSDSLGVYVEPKDGELVMKKNRDIEFDGSVFSGNFQFQGSEFTFDYNNFWVDMEKIDKISFVIKEKAADGKKGGSNKQSLGSPTQHSNGKLFINKPDNKSNRKTIPRYPYFDAETGSNMYFNRPEVLGGVYDTTIFFNVPPFSVDSLDKKSGNSAIDFKGKFYSGDIFPPFDERLHVMPDASLGFEHMVPATGYSVFGKGTFFNKITLNAGGIRGNGKLTYMNATLLSEDFIYYNDSVTTRPGSTATLVPGNVKGVYIPDAVAKNYWLRWDARADSMHIGSGKEPIQLYKNILTLNGNITLTPGGLYGRGATENPEAKITSTYFHFKEDFFTGRHSTFAVKGEGKKAALRATDALVEFDIKKRTAQFSPEVEGVASITFPALQYKTSISGGKADFNTKMVTMQMPAGSDIRKSYFYSTHPGQDSLVFMATGATFDMQKTTLNAYGVPYIPVLDSHIIPDSGRVYVTAGANMRTLRNAQIVMDSAQKHHHFHSGELTITSSKRFTGKATYKFVNAGDTEFGIPFTDFSVDSVKESMLRKELTYFTKAQGYAEEASNFFITPGVLYKGDITAFSNKRDLKVKGFAKFAFREDVSSDWFKFEQDVNPSLVGFSVDELTSADGAKLHTGLHISSATNTPYSTFASKKADEKDLDVLKVTGVFSYDKTRREYVIGSEDRVLKGALSGNIMRYNNQTAGINFGGRFNLIKPNKNFIMESGGYGIGDPENNSYKLTLTLAIDPAMPSQAVDAMAAGLNLSAGTQAINPANDTMLIYRLAEFVGDKDAKQYRQKATDVITEPWPKFSAKLVHSLMLSQVDMHWSQAQNAWYNKGQIGVANVGKQEINKFMTGHFEVRKAGTGNVVSLYLESDPNNWYYIMFADSVLKMVSSDEAFNTAVRAKASKKAPSANTFAMLPGEEMDRYEFVNYFRTTYLGKKDGAMAPPPPKIEANDGIQSAGDVTAEETGGKKKKKKKGRQEETNQTDTGIPAAGIEEAAGTTATENTGIETATENTGATPAEPSAKKEKKKKDKKKKEETLFPAETPAAGTETPAENNSIPPAGLPVQTEPVKQPEPTTPQKQEPETTKVPEMIQEANPADNQPAPVTEKPAEKKKKEKKVKEKPAEQPSADSPPAGTEITPPAEQATPAAPVKEQAQPVIQTPEVIPPATTTDPAPTEEKPVPEKKKKEKKKKEEEPPVQEPTSPADLNNQPAGTENTPPAAQPADTGIPEQSIDTAPTEEPAKKKKEKKKKKEEEAPADQEQVSPTEEIPSNETP